MKFLFSKLIILLFLSSCTNNKENWDNHIHVFSEDLYNELNNSKFNSSFFTKEPEYYSDLDSIMNDSFSDRVALISTGYAFGIENRTEEILYKLLKLENDHLSSLTKKHNTKAIGIYGINPLNSFALKEIKRCHSQQKFGGIKFHFHSSNVDLRNPDTVNKMRPIFRFLSDNEIPVLIHLKNHLNEFGDIDIDIFFEELIKPNSKIKLIFAHLGGDGLVTNQTSQIVNSIIEITKKRNTILNLIFLELLCQIKS